MMHLQILVLAHISKCGVATKMAWAKNGTPDTLGGSADVMTISDLTATKFNVILGHKLATTSTDFNITYDNNTATDYTSRYSDNGGADGTQINAAKTIHTGSGTIDEFVVGYIINIASEEKLSISFGMGGATGAGTAPARREAVGKVDTTTNSGQFTRIDVTNAGAGDYLTSSNVSMLGTD
jgi:hypothetical protein